MVQIITNSNWWGWVWLYKYKGSVDYYTDLPTSWMKVWDTYNVVNAFTKDGKDYPAWTNVAWTGTDWDPLWWSIDLSDYQKKLVEWDGIDLDQDTNEISVEDTVINWAAAWATAVQPWDDVSDLNNDAGYITSSDIPTNVSAFNNDAGYLVSSDLKQSDWWQSDSSKIDYIKNKPTIWNATLTIQKNGTTVNSITMNSTSNVTANISVPTDTSDLTNWAGFITNSALSGYQTTTNLVTDLSNPDNTHYPSAKAVSDAITASGGGDMLKSVYDPNNVAANAFDYTNFINTPTIPSVIDALNSTSTTDALSANQWKVLKDAIDNLSWLWKFLSLWNSSTGQPISFPLSTPYTYTTWDWFMVEIVDTTDPITNYKPTWSSYTGTASTTVESWTVKQWDVYIYDGTDWLLQVNNEPQVSFSEIAWQPTDNSNLATALSAKANDSDVVKLTGNQTIAWTKTFSTSPVVPSKTSAATNTWTAIATEAQVKSVADAIPTKVSQLSNDSNYATTSQIPTVNNATLTIQKNWTTVNTFTANASSNVTANISVPTDTWDLTNWAGFITGITSWDVTTALWYTPQSALATQTAYTTKWTSTKVPTITTNTLWQVTGITETSIDFPVTSVNGSTWAVTVNDTKVASSAPTATEWTLWYDSANDKLKAYNGSSWDEIWWGITKVFTLSSTSDLVNAQAAYDWLANWWMPIIKYGSVYYNLSYAEASWISFTYNVTNQSASWTTTTFNWLNRLYFTVSSNAVTAITLFKSSINLRTAAPTSWDNGTITIVI